MQAYYLKNGFKMIRSGVMGSVSSVNLPPPLFQIFPLFKIFYWSIFDLQCWLGSSVQQSESVVHTHISTLF